MKNRRFQAALVCGCVLAVASPAYADTSTSTATTSSWSSEATTNLQQQGCDPTVAANIAAAQDAQIKAQTLMAHTLYDYIKQNGHSAASCLSSLMPSATFALPNTSDLWNRVASMVCSKIQEVADPTVSTITSKVSQVEGSLSGYSSLSLGNGSFNLGTIPTGFSVSSTGQALNTQAIVNDLYDNTANGTFNYGSNASQYINTSNLLKVSGQ